jgi:hypothetical protein
MRTLGLLAGAALVLAACAGRQPEPLTISEITVDADLPAIGSPQAVAYWQGLSSDLETALAAEFAGQLDPLGKSILVDVDELTLTTGFAPGATLEDARLAGRVTLQNTDGTTASAYDVTATSSDVVSYLPEGTTVVSPTSAEYYQAIVLAFARGAAEVVAAGGST